MPERITGIDIGRDSIKAVTVSGGLKGCRVVDAALVRIDEAGGVPAALDQLFQREPFRGTPCVTALPLESFSFREVRLPFRDRKRIRQTLPYELEQMLPFSIDDALVDYLVLNQSEETDLLAVVVRKAVLDERLALLAPFAKSVPVVDAETVPLAGWLLQGSDADAVSILLDAGAARTSLVIVSGGRIVHLRSLPLGGERVTKSLAEGMGVDYEEAERRKRDGGSGVDEALDAFCRELHREVSNTVDMLMLRRILSEPPSRLYLAGGCSLSNRFRNELGRLFSLDAREPTFPQQDSLQFSGEAQKNWIPAVMNQALALALREAARGKGFNFVRGGFTASGILEKLRDDVPWAGPVAAAVIILLGLNLFLDYRDDSRYLSHLRQETVGIFSRTMPEVTRIVDPVQQMQTAVADIRRAAAGPDQSGYPVTVLSVLRDISRLVPESVDFLITNFTYDEQSIRIQGETDNFNTVDTIRAALDQGDAFGMVTISSANLMRQGGRVSFDLRMELRR